MTFRREVDKAIKAYLKPLGFKFKTKPYDFFYKYYTDDIILAITYAAEPIDVRHYYLRTFVDVCSKSLNDIIFELTDGRVDNNKFFTGPVWRCGPSSNNDSIHCEFINARPMEENIAGFEKMYNTEIVPLYVKYCATQKALYTCAVCDKYFNGMNLPQLWFYVPFAHYLEGQFDKAFEFIDYRIQIDHDLIARFGENEDDIEEIKTWNIYRENLKKWIEQKHTIKVDDEYLPKCWA